MKCDEHADTYTLTYVTGLPDNVLDWVRRFLFVLGDSERRLTITATLDASDSLVVYASDRFDRFLWTTINPRRLASWGATPYSIARTVCTAFLRAGWDERGRVDWERLTMWPLHSRFGRLVWDRSPSRLRPARIKTREFVARRIFWRLYWIERESR